ncbi:MAG: class I SAM-dependent methyltransferase [Gammaproteobacteria bacterium]
MRSWYATLAGEQLLQDIKRRVDGMVPDLFGYHAVQVDCLAPRTDLLDQSRIRHRLRTDLDKRVADVAADGAALPFDADSIDLMLLMHTLDLAAEPHRVLREAERVLIPEGRLIVIGFNPWSVYGLWRLGRRWRRQAPWCVNFCSGARLDDWLSLLGFEVETCDYAGFMPPLQHQRLRNRLTPIERLASGVVPMMGGVRVLLARKQVATLTPLKPSWRRRSLVPGKLAEPSARTAESCARRAS